jgi:trimethylamine:corrinoid methyltransferase-like protein
MLIKDNDKEKILADIYRLLEEPGLKVENEELKAAMITAGCKEKIKNRISIPKTLIEEIAEKQKKSQEEDAEAQDLIYNCNVDWTHSLLWKHKISEMKKNLEKKFLMPAFDCGPTRYYDYENKREINVTTDIFILMKKLAQATPEIGYTSNWYRSDAVPIIERLESLILAFQYTDKSAGVEAIYPELIKYIKEASEIISGDSGDEAGTYLAGGQCITPPLFLENRSAQEILERYKCGIRKYHVASMGVLGMSMPITLAGAVVVSSSEILGGWAAVFVVDPDAYFNGRMISNNINMRTLEIGCSGPETILLNTGVKEIFDSFFGGHLWVETYFSPAAAEPGLQAVCENYYGSMARSRIDGRPYVPYCGVGTLGNGGTGSPTQLMLDMEVRKSEFHLKENIEVNDSVLCHEEIVAILKDGRQFLDSENTLKNYKELWESRIFTAVAGKKDPGAVNAQKEILDRCDRMWRDNVKDNYEYNGLETEKLRELNAVLERAKKSLLR